MSVLYNQNILAPVLAQCMIIYFHSSKFTSNLFPTKRRGGHAMAKVVGRRPLTTEARVFIRVRPCWISGGQSGTGTGFSSSSSVFHC
jgi:hypothetical protein